MKEKEGFNVKWFTEIFVSHSHIFIIVFLQGLGQRPVPVQKFNF